MSPLRIGTRGSTLALWQAHYVRDRLRALAPQKQVELVEIETEGDRIRDVPLVQLGGQGAFTKAIQQALLDGRADIAVHSLKDLPTFAVEGLMLAAAPERGPTGDAFVSVKHRAFESLPADAVVATSSLRRRAQILHRRPDLKLVDMRGNVETRLRKLVEQSLDAIILAEAGLVRLRMSKSITEILDRSWMLPAVGQGALGLECRTHDKATRELLARLDHKETHAAVLAERAMLRGLGGGCAVPIGAATTIQDETLTLRGGVLSPDGSQRIEAESNGSLADPGSLGQQVADTLLARGAAALLKV
jgi:hydroxymethylbilane synthase